MNAAVERLIEGINNPVVAQSLLEAFKQKQPIEVSSVPRCAYASVFLLATLAHEWREPEIVDDYDELFTLVKTAFDDSVPGFWHPDGMLASSVIFLNAKLSGLPEAEWLSVAYRELTGTFVDSSAASPHANHAQRAAKKERKNLRAAAKLFGM